MSTLTVEEMVEAGLDPTYNAADSGGDTFKNESDRRIFLHVKNGDTSSHSVTVAADQSSVSLRDYGKLSKSDIVVSVPAGEARFVGPFPRVAFGPNPAISYSSTTGMTVAVVKVP